LLEPDARAWQSDPPHPPPQHTPPHPPLRGDGFTDRAMIARRVRRGDPLRGADDHRPVPGREAAHAYPDESRNAAERSMFFVAMGAASRTAVARAVEGALGSGWVSRPDSAAGRTRRRWACRPAGADGRGRDRESSRPRSRPAPGTATVSLHTHALSAAPRRTRAGDRGAQRPEVRASPQFRANGSPVPASSMNEFMITVSC